MKYLTLLVDDDVIRYDPTCSYDDLCRGMTEPVKLDFTFSPEWKTRPKVVKFLSLTGKELSAHILKSGKSCIIPAEVLKHPAFRIQILGKENGIKVSTTSCTIYLKGGKA